MKPSEELFEAALIEEMGLADRDPGLFLSATVALVAVRYVRQLRDETGRTLDQLDRDFLLERITGQKVTPELLARTDARIARSFAYMEKMQRAIR